MDHLMVKKEIDNLAVPEGTTKDLTNATLSRKRESCLFACISPRFSTVIHILQKMGLPPCSVDLQINYNCYIEPFAVS